MSVTIGPLQTSDFERWRELWGEYQTFYRVALPPEVTESLWERIQDGRVHGLAARDSSGQLVGIVHFLLHENTWSTAPACYLQDLYVDQRVRGTGCGRALIEAVAHAAQAAGANSPYWLTHQTNAVARRLYDRIGRNEGYIHYGYAAPAPPKSGT